MLEESSEIHGDIEAMNERIEYLASVYSTEGMCQQVSELGRQTDELQQVIKLRRQNIQDAAKVWESTLHNELTTRTILYETFLVYCDELERYI